MGPDSIINLQDYSPLELIIFGVGAFFWVLIYFVVIKNIIKHQAVEIPVVAIAANIAWEFWRSFVYGSDMGLLFVWGYRLWFFLDLYIVYAAYKYGAKQILSPALKKHFPLTFTVGIIGWFAILYFGMAEYDDSVGALTGYILTILMNSAFWAQIVKQPSFGMSYTNAWFKFLGNGLVSVFCFMHFPTHKTLLTMCVLGAILDMAYIYIFPRATQNQEA